MQIWSEGGHRLLLNHEKLMPEGKDGAMKTSFHHRL